MLTAEGLERGLNLNTRNGLASDQPLQTELDSLPNGRQIRRNGRGRPDQDPVFPLLRNKTLPSSRP